MTPLYKIVRNYVRGERRVVLRRGLTMLEAKTHCQNPQTSSSTCTSFQGRDLAARRGPWYDTWEADHSAQRHIPGNAIHLRDDQWS